VQYLFILVKIFIELSSKVYCRVFLWTTCRSEDRRAWWHCHVICIVPLLHYVMMSRFGCRRRGQLFTELRSSQRVCVYPSRVSGWLSRLMSLLVERPVVSCLIHTCYNLLRERAQPTRSILAIYWVSVPFNDFVNTRVYSPRSMNANATSFPVTRY